MKDEPFAHLDQPAAAIMAMGLHGGGNRGRRGSTRRAPMAEINVTPLVDVMLVLLIIFMVTAPLLTAGVPVDLPDSRAKALDQPDRAPVTLALDGDGRVFIGEDEVTMADLPNRLAAIAADDADAAEKRTIMLRADRTLDYGAVMRVMGELNRAGLSRVSMVTTSGVAPSSGTTSGVAPSSGTTSAVAPSSGTTSGTSTADNSVTAGSQTPQ